MWSPNSTVVHAGLSPHAVVLAYRSGPISRQRWIVREFPCEPGSVGWANVLPVLAKGLAELPLARARVKVQLAGTWVRWLLIPWNDALVRSAEYQAYAKAQFAQSFGSSAQQWVVVHCAQRPGAMQAACAVDAALVAELHEMLQRAGARLEQVSPYSSHAFDQWQRHLSAPDSWFCALESDTLWVLRVQKGDLQALHVQRWSERWQEALAATIETVGLTLAPHGTRSPLYVASPLPPVASTPQWPFNWVHAKGIPATESSAIRLALGV